MELRFHNTLTRSLEPFEPLDPPRVGVYACGPTVYQPPHIGNFRTFLFNDLLRRVLEYAGYDVRFVMNLTDVDDKTIDGARARGLALDAYTAPIIDGFLDALRRLGVRDGMRFPRATHHIEDMVALVRRLEERGHAYLADDGSVYYDISSFDGYGRLSRLDQAGTRAGAGLQRRERRRVATDEYGKEDARDFVLWKAARPVDHEVGAVWATPWGSGRPGWHIECSAMSMAELGESFDIHTGGEDLVFPHHEDEIAQSEGATGQPFVRVWLHVKHLLVDGEKMSKSKGNVYTLDDLEAQGHTLPAVRLQLLSAHYRSELNFTTAGLDDARAA
ncbi:MAG: cysteine--tRNA ligase, partial [Longimicrobiales bacterium]